MIDGFEAWTRLRECVDSSSLRFFVARNDPWSLPDRMTAIRDVRDDDIPSITAIYAHAVTHGTASYELEPPDEGEMLRRMRQIATDGFPYLVAEEAGRIAGYAYGNHFRTRRAYRFLVEDSVYVAPDFQGSGHGRRLLDALIARCEASGFRQMLAVIGGSDHEPSIRLHARCGFRQVGCIAASGFKHGRWLDTLFMQRPLGEGATTKPA